MSKKSDFEVRDVHNFFPGVNKRHPWRARKISGQSGVSAPHKKNARKKAVTKALTAARTGLVLVAVDIINSEGVQSC